MGSTRDRLRKHGRSRQKVVKEGQEVERFLSRGSLYLALGGLASVVFGVICLVYPGISLLALTALFGALALVYGSFALGGGLNMLAHRSTDWVPYVLGGLAGIAVGAITFFYPSLTALTLIYFIAAWAIITGVFEIVAGIDFRTTVNGAVWLAVSGALSVVFGAIVALRPGSGALAILWLIGIYAILGGGARLFAAYQVYRVRREAKSAVGAMEAQS
jgi:uncharacterized membrane protein HdeD (DUF308 family)